MVVFAVYAGSAQPTRDMPKNKEPIKLIEKIVGTWRLQQIADETASQKDAQKKKSAVATDDPENNALQRLEFDPEGRYTTGSRTDVLDSGSYRINEQQGILYMESDQDNLTPVEWKIAFQRNLMTLTGRNEKAEAKPYKYIYLRTKKGLSTN